MDVALEKRQVERAYELLAPVYDFIFDWIFAPGRSAAIKQLALQRSDSVLEVGIGTGLNLPLYPWSCNTSMDFGENEFDKAAATYTISAVPDPVAVLREMRRVVKPGGIIVLLNHFRSQRRVTGWAEDLVAPVCTRLGWKSNLMLEPLLEQVGLVPESVTQVNMFKGWRLVKCINRK